MLQICAIIHRTYVILCMVWKHFAAKTMFIYVDAPGVNLITKYGVNASTGAD